MGVIAKSEWRGGEQKKLEKLEFDMPTTTYTTTPLTLMKSLCSNFQADSMRWRRCGACGRAFGFPIDFIADSP